MNDPKGGLIQRFGGWGMLAAFVVFSLIEGVLVGLGIMAVLLTAQAIM